MLKMKPVSIFTLLFTIFSLFPAGLDVTLCFAENSSGDIHFSDCQLNDVVANKSLNCFDADTHHHDDTSLFCIDNYLTSNRSLQYQKVLSGEKISGAPFNCSLWDNFALSNIKAITSCKTLITSRSHLDFIKTVKLIV